MGGINTRSLSMNCPLESHLTPCISSFREISSLFLLVELCTQEYTLFSNFSTNNKSCILLKSSDYAKDSWWVIQWTPTILGTSFFKKVTKPFSFPTIYEAPSMKTPINLSVEKTLTSIKPFTTSYVFFLFHHKHLWALKTVKLEAWTLLSLEMLHKLQYVSPNYNPFFHLTSIKKRAYPTFLKFVSFQDI